MAVDLKGPKRAAVAFRQLRRAVWKNTPIEIPVGRMVLQLLLLRLMEYAVDHAGDLLPAKPRPRTTGKVIHLHEWRERQ